MAEPVFDEIEKLLPEFSSDDRGGFFRAAEIMALIGLGIDPSHSGFGELCRAISSANERLTNLYSRGEISERNIRYALERAFDSPENTALIDYFAAELSEHTGKVTNKTFIRKLSRDLARILDSKDLGVIIEARRREILRKLGLGEG